MFNWDKAPIHIRETIRLYVERRCEPGHFMTAVLENNLKEACARADEINKYQLFDIVQFLYWEVPSICWGSPESVHEWLCRKEGEENAEAESHYGP
jgi:hypothetical protein